MRGAWASFRPGAKTRTAHEAPTGPRFAIATHRDRIRPIFAILPSDAPCE
jgi:hypothetical protein